MGIADVARKGDTNLKDWIIFHADEITCSETQRDNTGLREFREVPCVAVCMYACVRACVRLHRTAYCHGLRPRAREALHVRCLMFMLCTRERACVACVSEAGVVIEWLCLCDGVSLWVR